MTKLPAVEFRTTEKGDDYYITLKVPRSLRPEAEAALASLASGYASVNISKPHKPRTTGEGSQSHHFHGHCGSIALALSLPPDMVKRAIKIMAMEDGYPGNEIGGVKVPMSEADADTTQEALLIEVTHRFAAEHNIPLIETEQEIKAKPEGFYTPWHRLTDDEKKKRDPKKFDDEKQLAIF